MMNTKAVITSVVWLLALAFIVVGASRSESVGASGKLAARLRGGYMGPSDIELLPQMGQVGMNAAIVKFGGIENTIDDSTREMLRNWAGACRENGLAFMPVVNFWGGHEEKWIPDYARYVDSHGIEYPNTPCPNSRAFWQKCITERIVATAQALSGDRLNAICIDNEMYGADFTIYPGPCYCAECYKRFMVAQGHGDAAIPEPAQRAKALADAGLEQAYSDFQVSRIEQMAAASRRALHAVNRDISIGVLHLDYLSSPLNRGMARGFGLLRLPVLCLTEHTYSTGYTEYVAEVQREFREVGASVDLLCGVWQSRFPPQNLAENLYYCAKNSQGYWIYTMQTFTAPDYSPLPAKPAEFWAAIKQADDELDKLAADPNYQSRLAVRTFEAPVIPLTSHGFKPFDLVPYAPDGKPGDNPRLRNRNTLYFYVREGDDIALELAFRQVGNYRDVGQFLLVSPEGSEIAHGLIRKDKPATVSAMAEASGVYGLLLNTGSNACEIVSTSHPYAVCVGNGIQGRFITKLPPLYCLLEEGSRDVVLGIKVEGIGEAIRASIRTDSGKQVYENEIVRPEHINLSIPKGTEYIVLTCEKLPDSVLEDVYLNVESGLYPFIATSPAGLLHKAQ